MNTIIIGDKKYEEYVYKREEEFEKDIISKSKELFGEKTYYINVKKLIKNDKNSGTIPDGYLLDCTYEKEPRLYIVENELNVLKIVVDDVNTTAKIKRLVKRS